MKTIERVAAAAGCLVMALLVARAPMSNRILGSLTELGAALCVVLLIAIGIAVLARWQDDYQ